MGFAGKPKARVTPTTVLDVTSTTTDPFINMTSLGSFNPNTYRYVRLRYRVISGTAGLAQLYFLNSTYTSANAAQLIESGALISDGRWHMLEFDGWAHASWKNSNITGWRFDWNVVSGVRIQFDYIELVSDDGNQVAFRQEWLTQPYAVTATTVNGSNVAAFIPEAPFEDAFWVAVTSTGTIMTSQDNAAKWTYRGPQGSAMWWMGIAGNGEQWVMTGANGKIATAYHTFTSLSTSTQILLPDYPAEDGFPRWIKAA